MMLPTSLDCYSKTLSSTNEANPKIETSLTAERKIRKYSNSSKPYTRFYAFHSLNHVLVLVIDNSLFHLFFS